MGKQFTTGAGRIKPTAKGYIRRYDITTKRSRMEHNMVWELHNGAIPDGFQVHHRNHIKTDNRIENLELLTPLEHKRLHSGCYKDDNGEWIKPCKLCGIDKPVETEYYKRKVGISPWCRECCINYAVENKRKRKNG